MEKVIATVVLGVALSLAVALSVSAVEDSDDSVAGTGPVTVSTSVSPVEADGVPGSADWAVPMFNFP